LALGLFTTVALVCICGVGRLTHSFDAGLGAAAVVGTAWAALSHRWAGTQGQQASLRNRWMLGLVIAGLLGVYGYVASQYQMHDEHAVFGHKSMVEQFRRNVYPLYYPSQPTEEARYHYGFDVMAGALARAYGASSDTGIDLVCLFFVVFMALAAASLAADADAEDSAPLAALAVHLGGGLAWWMLAGVPGRHPRCLAQYHHPTCEVELFPAQFLNVFQHPVSAGVPLFLVMALVLPRLLDRPEGGAARRSYLGLVLASVAI
ncbi:unnamed protein product, partial [Laminaria digitata]